MAFTGFSRSSQAQAQERQKKATEVVLSLANLVEGLLMTNVAPFFESPRDLVNLALASKSVSNDLSLPTHPRWEEMYAQRWPVFHESMKHMGATGWYRIYKLTVEGQCACLLEVFHRQKHQAFALCTQAAWVRWDAKASCYMAKYVSAQPVEPEAICSSEASRLRFCPATVRSTLRPGRMPSPEEQTNREAPVFPYPYRVLESVDESLKIGSGVEVQFKMQKDSPFGWWYGRLESLQKGTETGNSCASATIAFDQFPEESCWRHMHVEFGDGKLRSNELGGFVGGLRACTAEEEKRWEAFFPSAVAAVEKKVG